MTQRAPAAPISSLNWKMPQCELLVDMAASGEAPNPYRVEFMPLSSLQHSQPVMNPSLPNFPRCAPRKYFLRVPGFRNQVIKIRKLHGQSG